MKIFGDGPLKKSFAFQVERLRLDSHIVLREGIPQEEVVNQMKEADILVLPCRRVETGDMDGIPTVFMEAMAIGRPVISCLISGIPELVRDGETGRLVPSNDPRSLASAIIELGQNEQLRIRFGRRARILVEKQHDIRTVVASKLNFLEHSKTDV